jgi:hypothetical protein
MESGKTVKRGSNQHVTPTKLTQDRLHNLRTQSNYKRKHRESQDTISNYSINYYEDPKVKKSTFFFEKKNTSPFNKKPKITLNSL